MKRTVTNLLKTALLGLAALVIVGATHKTARADEVTISGSTTGIVTGVPQLTFSGNQFFTGTTSLGFGSLSGANSLGTFFLGTAPASLVSGTFQLNITFASPGGISTGQGTTYTATIVGSVSPNIDQGGVNIHFLNPSQGFAFNDGTGGGSFSLTVADLFVQSGRSANLTAGIVGERIPGNVPEPTTLLLLGTGVAGIAAKLRRRKKSKDAANEIAGS